MLINIFNFFKIDDDITIFVKMLSFIFSYFLFGIYQITLPVVSGYIYIPTLSLVSAILNTIALVSPLITYLLSHYIINQDESWCEVFNTFLNIITALIESILRISNVVISWIYYAQPQQGLYTVNILLSCLTSFISLILLIYMIPFIITVIKQEQRKCNYISI
jgi:hypothetical protein